jgi:hypothetical protein
LLLRLLLTILLVLQMDMEDKDVIDVMYQQTGGNTVW